MLFAKVLQCVEDDTKIILIGDINQLPSVQAGNILGDLILSKKINVCRLTDITRQQQDSNIIKYCAEINRGNCIDECDVHDFVYKEFETDDEIMQEFINSYVLETKEHGFGNVQVMTPYKKGDLGTCKLNEYISGVVNHNEKDETFGYKLGDKVMQLTNNYDKDVFNGETGVVSNIDEDYIYIDFDKGTVQYPIEEINDLTLAYANTIHKAQGSEYPTVFVILDNMSQFLLIRKILYTAVSRGKKKVYLYSKPFCVDRCISNDFYKERITKLKQFLQG
jgi:exodeoxyribonuclease V alpha subunit